MEKKQTRGIILCAFLFLILCLGVGGCHNKRQVKQSQTMKKEKQAAQKKSKAKPYDLTIPAKEEKTYEKECIEVMKSCSDLYRDCDVKNPDDTVLADEQLTKMAKQIAKSKAPVYLYNGNIDMINYQSLEQFIQSVEKNNNAIIHIYELVQNGGMNRTTYCNKDGKLVSTMVCLAWDANNKPYVTYVNRCEVKSIEYTKKGWLMVENAVNENCSEVVDGSFIIRVKPVKKEYRKAYNKYIAPIGYQGNNLFRVNWDKGSMKRIAFNDLYDFTYPLVHGKSLDATNQKSRIKQKEFEQVILPYFAISAESLRELAHYDPKKKEYKWGRIGFGNQIPDIFYEASSEVVGIKENKDHTKSLTVDVVTEGDDIAFTHIVTIEDKENGGWNYVGNRLVGVKEQDLPNYIPRTKK
ncbi:hypothetical protein lbkm_1635 [Lachnospiraceae bacterium KM106-2]|nr:hypothetical protein lbkm_1635 [Lachnospiraceae bacterium KM106-2]